MRQTPKTRHELAQLIDHTNLSPGATREDIQKLCKEAKRFGFHAVCVSPFRTREAAALLRGTGIKVATVVGFPFGYSKLDTKLLETRLATRDGASEIDLVPNLGQLVSGKREYVRNEISSISQLCKSRHVLLKVIIETPLLTRKQIIGSSRLVADAGGDFVKTCTGFGSRGATVRDVRLIHSAVGEKLGIKAAGGIRNAQQAMKLIASGATRIGSSQSVRIIWTF